MYISTHIHIPCMQNNIIHPTILSLRKTCYTNLKNTKKLSQQFPQITKRSTKTSKPTQSITQKNRTKKNSSTNTPHIFHGCASFDFIVIKTKFNFKSTHMNIIINYKSYLVSYQSIRLSWGCLFKIVCVLMNLFRGWLLY